MEINELNRAKKKLGLLCQWIRLQQRGIGLAEFFQDREIGSIAIYGMGEIGLLLYDELEKENESLVKYAIDKSGKAFREYLPTYWLKKGLPPVDAIIITPVLITDEIEEEIYDAYGETVTYVFEEILYELSKKHRVESSLWR